MLNACQIFGRFYLENATNRFPKKSSPPFLMKEGLL